MHLTTDKKQRKAQPIARGFLDYFPNAIAEVAHVSFVGNQQHNPGEELHWSRGKSDDHADCIVRHLIERGTLDDDGLRHSAKAAWRALAALQLEIEKDANRVTAQASAPAKDIAYQPATKPIPFLGIHQNLMYSSLSALGCPDPIARLIVGGTTFPSGSTRGLKDHGSSVYVAGPMRGFEHFNFPAFDAARDALLKKGISVISPADIDRAATPDADNPEKIDVSDQTVFVFRDFWSLYFLRKIGDGNGIVLLDGWHKSTGATAEFFLARWLGLKIFSQGGAEITADEAMAAFSFHI